MKHNSFGLCPALALLFLGSGCVTTTPPPITPDEALERAYQTHSFIGLKSDPQATCPAIEGWEEGQLFKNDRFAERQVAVPVASAARREPLANGDFRPCGAEARTLDAVRQEMRRYCSYRRIRKDAKIPARPVLGLVKIDRDPLALSVSADTLAATVQPRFAENFFRQVGRAGITLPIQDDAPKVRLAFIDDHPKSFLTERDSPALNQDRAGRTCKSGHGDFLRLVGRRMTCEEGGRCATDISTRLALAYRRFDPETSKPTDRDDTCGGSIGNFEDLAQAIDDEVADWQAEWDGDRPRRPLILNLSLGWDGSKFGGLDDNGQNLPYCELPLGPRAVYNSLQKAHLLGALVFAAAGNDRLGPEPLTGPLLPAAWERSSPGEEEACKDRRDYPLVYAVGALQADGRPLVNARRRGAMPTLAAYADHAALGDLGPWPTQTYTGTSVATAVVSSVAAMIWHQNANFAPEAVVRTLRSSGSPTSRIVDFMYSSPDDTAESNVNVRRISLCPALQGIAGLSCSLLRPERMVLSDLLHSPLKARRLERELRICGTGDHAVHRMIYSDRPLRATDNPCPSETLADLSSVPAASPQPGNDPCPNCTDPPNRASAIGDDPASEGHILYIEIDPHWPSDKVLLSMTFELDSGEETPPSRYLSFVPPAPGIGAGDTRQVLLPAGEFNFTSASQAKIHWVIRIDGTPQLYTSPVFVAD